MLLCKRKYFYSFCLKSVSLLFFISFLFLFFSPIQIFLNVSQILTLYLFYCEFLVHCISSSRSSFLFYIHFALSMYTLLSFQCAVKEIGRKQNCKRPQLVTIFQNILLEWRLYFFIFFPSFLFSFFFLNSFYIVSMKNLSRKFRFSIVLLFFPA